MSILSYYVCDFCPDRNYPSKAQVEGSFIPDGWTTHEGEKFFYPRLHKCPRCNDAPDPGPEFPSIEQEIPSLRKIRV